MPEESLNHCIVCSSELISDHLECTDHFVSRESFMISICDSCGFCFTNPRPLPADSARYYDSESYISHSKTSRGIINRLFHLARKYTMRNKRRIVQKYSSGNALLDYGCGTGEFLAHMKKAGWACSGIEPNAAAREQALSAFGLTVGDENNLDSIADGSLDAITLWHVLEHVYPIESRLLAFQQKLKAGGMLFVALPNMKSYDAKKYGRYWAAYDVPRHIYHFNPDTIKSLIEKNGFSHHATKPMLLDALYISMLSEKYMHGAPKNVKAIFRGIRSNISAFFGNGNYSSLIYIFKKSI